MQYYHAFSMTVSNNLKSKSITGFAFYCLFAVKKGVGGRTMMPAHKGTTKIDI